eukprot:11626196-Alexandrium_andersonii.AAC.1
MAFIVWRVYVIVGRESDGADDEFEADAAGLPSCLPGLAPDARAAEPMPEPAPSWPADRAALPA